MGLLEVKTIWILLIKKTWSWTRGSGKNLWGLNPEKLKGKMPPFLPDVPVVREDLADYLGEAMAFDECCRILLEELKATGEYDNTLIVISGDHGAPGFPRGKTNCYDFGARVLFAARWPGHIQPAQILKKPISLIDLAPTFLAAAGLEKADTMHGENLLPALDSGDHSGLRSWALIGREVHVETARDRQLPYSIRSIPKTYTKAYAGNRDYVGYWTGQYTQNWTKHINLIQPTRWSPRVQTAIDIFQH